MFCNLGLIASYEVHPHSPHRNPVPRSHFGPHRPSQAWAWMHALAERTSEIGSAVGNGKSKADWKRKADFTCFPMCTFFLFFGNACFKLHAFELFKKDLKSCKYSNGKVAMELFQHVGVRGGKVLVRQCFCY